MTCASGVSTCVVRCVHDVTIVFRCSLMAANVTRTRATYGTGGRRYIRSPKCENVVERRDPGLGVTPPRGRDTAARRGGGERGRWGLAGARRGRGERGPRVQS